MNPFPSRRWSDCQLLADQLKQRLLNLPPTGTTPPAPAEEAEQSTAEAIADLERRRKDLRQRYGL
ncbi:MAG: hypothetical protein HC824_08185 [Synechococcales cyanobacterium RM1_1_8]|nr:hypothetical protein [Synechococcales cyanobacterium RM1_1_8]